MKTEVIGKERINDLYANTKRMNDNETGDETETSRRLALGTLPASSLQQRQYAEYAHECDAG
jgi:hypothetical protein